MELNCLDTESCLDTDSFTVSHEILCILWEAQLQCCVYKSLPLVRTSSEPDLSSPRQPILFL